MVPCNVSRSVPSAVVLKDSKLYHIVQLTSATDAAFIKPDIYIVKC